MEKMSSGERYKVRVQISVLYREANQHEDRQTEEGRIRAMECRHRAIELNEMLKRRKS